MGAYATVFSVKSLKNGKHYAAKILKNDPDVYAYCSKYEKKILIDLNKVEKSILKHAQGELGGVPRLSSSRIVILKDHFSLYQEEPIPVAHFVLIFEKLDISLFDVLESTGCQGLTLCMIQRFGLYAMEGLHLLKTVQVTHSDIKPENIMLVE